MRVVPGAKNKQQIPGSTLHPAMTLKVPHIPPCSPLGRDDEAKLLKIPQIWGWLPKKPHLLLCWLLAPKDGDFEPKSRRENQHLQGWESFFLFFFLI